MSNMEKIETGGMLAISGKEFNCLIGDSKDEIAERNPDLTSVEVDIVFDLTREARKSDNNEIE